MVVEGKQERCLRGFFDSWSTVLDWRSLSELGFSSRASSRCGDFDFVSASDNFAAKARLPDPEPDDLLPSIQLLVDVFDG